MGLSDVEFVTGWMKGIRAGKSQAQTAKEMGVHRAGATRRALYLRRLGVNLPKFTDRDPPRNKGELRVDVEGLNALIQETLQEGKGDEGKDSFVGPDPDDMEYRSGSPE